MKMKKGKIKNEKKNNDNIAKNKRLETWQRRKNDKASRNENIEKKSQMINEE